MGFVDVDKNIEYHQLYTFKQKHASAKMQETVFAQVSV